MLNKQFVLPIRFIIHLPATKESGRGIAEANQNANKYLAAKNHHKQK